MINIIILTIVIILLLIFAIYFGYPIYHSLEVSKVIQQASSPYEQHPSDPKMKILVAGDSTGVGTGAKIPMDSTAGRLGQDFPQADIKNISENGLKMEGLSKKLEILGSDHYDLILIQIGANDVTGLTGMNKVNTDLSLILDQAENHADRVIILTSGNIGNSPVFKAPLSYYISQRTLNLRKIFISEVAKRPKVNYVDLFQNANADIFLTDIHRYYAADLFHPSSDGYGLWYQAIQKVLRENK